jgi:hypothetical protein
MPSKPGFVDYVAAAFNARPFGMFVAPNWVGLAAFGMLGLLNPGFWVLGAGLEAGYLLTLATNRRFQRAVASRPLAESRAEWNTRIGRLIGRLPADDRERYEALAARCRAILDLQTHGGSDLPHGIEAQADSLGRLSCGCSSRARRSRRSCPTSGRRPRSRPGRRRSSGRRPTNRRRPTCGAA